MKALRLLAFLPTLLVLLAACDGGGSKSTGPSVVISGDYRGIERANFGTTSLQVSVVQSGSSVTGSYATGLGDAGTFTGTVSGTSFSATLRSTRLPGVSCDLSGVASNGGATLEGTFACSDGTAGAFTLTRV